MTSDECICDEDVSTGQIVRVGHPSCPTHGVGTEFVRPLQYAPCKVIQLTPDHFAEAQYCRDVETWVRAVGYTY